MNTQELEKRKFELFEKVLHANLDSFVNSVKSECFNYIALNTNKIISFDEDEVRSLAVNFFTKELTKKVNENVSFYFDKKVTTKY